VQVDVFFLVTFFTHTCTLEFVLKAMHAPHSVDYVLLLLLHSLIAVAWCWRRPIHSWMATTYTWSEMIECREFWKKSKSYSKHHQNISFNLFLCRCS